MRPQAEELTVCFSYFSHSDAAATGRDENTIELPVKIFEFCVKSTVYIVYYVGIVQDAKRAFIYYPTFINHKTVLILWVVAVAVEHTVYTTARFASTDGDDARFGCLLLVLYSVWNIVRLQVFCCRFYPRIGVPPVT